MPDNAAGRQATADGRSVGELVALVSKDLSTLVRGEIELAKAEVYADGKRAAIGAGLFVAAGLMGHLVVIVLSVALALGLHAAGLWDWLAFLVVGVFYILVAGLMVLVGIRWLKKVTGPRKTLATLKADTELVHRDGGATQDDAAPSAATP